MTNRCKMTADDIDRNKVAQKSKYAETIFFSSLAGVSIIFGFGLTLGMAKKKDPHMFAKGFLMTREVPESGSALAMRALRRATVYAFAGVGLLSLGIWKAMGVHNFKEFNEKMASIMPKAPKKEQVGRTEFEGFRDLFDYIISEDEKQKQKAKGSNS